MCLGWRRVREARAGQDVPGSVDNVYLHAVHSALTVEPCKCLPYENGDPMVAPNCYYAIERVVGFEVPPGVTLNGTDEVDQPGAVSGTFNGRGGADKVFVVAPGGNVNGGNGDDRVLAVVGGTFNGGGGDDVAIQVYDDGTFNGGPGDDCAADVGSYVKGTDGTFAGGSGSDTYFNFYGGDIWSAEQAGPCPF